MFKEQLFAKSFIIVWNLWSYLLYLNEVWKIVCTLDTSLLVSKTFFILIICAGSLFSDFPLNLIFFIYCPEVNFTLKNLTWALTSEFFIDVLIGNFELRSAALINLINFHHITVVHQSITFVIIKLIKIFFTCIKLSNK